MLYIDGKLPGCYSYKAVLERHKAVTTIVRLGELADISQGLSTSGRGAGKRSGEWRVRLISVGSIQEDRLVIQGLHGFDIEQNARTEKHLLETDDLLITARSTVIKAALVPPLPFRAVADATLLVVRPYNPQVAPFLSA